MIARLFPAHWISLIPVFLVMLIGGCVSMPLKSGSPVEFQSFDLPEKLDSNTVIRAVELAFVQALATTPRIIEGTVRYPLPVKPVAFTMEDRRLRLERLGTVTIREVGCPGNVAVMHAWAADHETHNLRRYTACIQLYAGAYRVHLIDSRLVSKGDDGPAGPAGAGLKSVPSLLPRVAEAFLAQMKEARAVTDSDIPESFPSSLTNYDKALIAPSAATLKRGSSSVPLSEGSGNTLAVQKSEREIVTTSPLVCLIPRFEAAAVRAQHGTGKVIQVIEQGSLTAVAESVDAAHFQVLTTEGLAGWVNSSDVRRLPCPIG